MAPKFYPSVMCMKESPPEEDIPFLERLGVDGFHVDITDDNFANDVISVDILRRVGECTTLPLGVHMMVRNPFDYLERLYRGHPETIYVHFEAENTAACLADMRAHSCLTGLAVCPETSVEAITGLLPLVDRLLLLRVPPGTTGHPPVPCADEKIERLLRTPNRHFDIVCDGAVSPEFVRTWLPHGIRHFVCGTASGLFHGEKASRLVRFEKLKQQQVMDR